VGLSRKIVRRILREEGLSTKAPCRHAQATKLAPFLSRIEALVSKGLTVTRILREIRGPDPKTGYKGGRTILAEHVRALRAALRPKKRAKRRFETRVGVEMQIDWSVYTVPIGGVPTRVHCLGCLLCWSRKLFLHFFRDERQSTLLEGLSMAFEYFQGATARVVLDNMATAVLGRIRPVGEPLWHPRFLDFSKHYGFKPFACRQRDPNRKAKKEKSFRLVEDDFVKGSEFSSFSDLNARARVWLDETPAVANSRVHGTTRLVPNVEWEKERSFLIRLPDERFQVAEQDVRLVDEDSTLSIEGTRYTVPEELADKPAAVRLYAFHFEVLDREGRVVFTRPYVEAKDKGKLVIEPTHYAPPVRALVSSGRVLDELLKRYPVLETLAAGIRLRMKALAPIHFALLLRLARRYGDDAFLAAARRVQEHRRFDAGAVRRILEREHPLPEGDLEVPPIGNAAGLVLLGEVEPPSLDGYAHLDRDPPAEAQNGT
jgi:transposase